MGCPYRMDVYICGQGGGGIGSFGVEDAGDEEVDADEGQGVGAQEEGYGGPADGGQSVEVAAEEVGGEEEPEDGLDGEAHGAPGFGFEFLIGDAPEGVWEAADADDGEVVHQRHGEYEQGEECHAEICDAYLTPGDGAEESRAVRGEHVGAALLLDDSAEGIGCRTDHVALLEHEQI